MRRPDAVLLPLTLGVLVQPVWAGFVSVARNRLVSGRPVMLLDMAAGMPAWLAGMGLLALLAGALLRRDRWALIGAAAVIVGLTWLAGAFAASVAATTPAARVSLGPAYFLMVGLGALLAAETARRLGARGQVAALLLILVPIFCLVLGGRLDSLSLLREYAAKRDVFGLALLRHGEIVGAALLPTLLLGVPLGVAAYRRPGLGRVVFPALGLVQTIPSIALFGLLMAPLSGLAALFPALGRAGISGIGLAPAVIALVLYSLLPITRNTTEGLAGVPAPVRDAARGLGMTPSRIFWQVDVPLAFPALLAGLRITLVQAIGLAAVAALIGAGGLGALMFDGLFAGAIDLVLLGALPVILMAVLADLLLRLAVRR